MVALFPALSFGEGPGERAQKPITIIYLIAIIGAFVAGCVNTLAGNGSAITLTILMELLGLPPDVANGTNRVGVLAQTTAGSWAFHREGKLERNLDWGVIGWVSVGALLGMYLSVVISPEGYRQFFRYMLVVMLVVILVRPKRWLTAQPERVNMPGWLAVPLYFLLGVYGGFIQMGMGVFFLAILVLIARYDLIGANVLKGVTVTVYTLAAVAFFAWKGLIAWPIGLLMAIGQLAGGFLTATYASRYPRANVWAYRLLVIVILGAIVRAFW